MQSWAEYQTLVGVVGTMEAMVEVVTTVAVLMPVEEGAVLHS